MFTSGICQIFNRRIFFLGLLAMGSISHGADRLPKEKVFEIIEASKFFNDAQGDAPYQDLDGQKRNLRFFMQALEKLSVEVNLHPNAPSNQCPLFSYYFYAWGAHYQGGNATAIKGQKPDIQRLQRAIFAAYFILAVPGVDKAINEAAAQEKDPFEFIKKNIDSWLHDKKPKLFGIEVRDDLRLAFFKQAPYSFLSEMKKGTYEIPKRTRKAIKEKRSLSTEEAEGLISVLLGKGRLAHVKTAPKIEQEQEQEQEEPNKALKMLADLVNATSQPLMGGGSYFTAGYSYHMMYPQQGMYLQQASQGPFYWFPPHPPQLRLPTSSQPATESMQLQPPAKKAKKDEATLRPGPRE